MALFGSNKKKTEPKISAKQRLIEQRAARRQQALETGFVRHPEIEQEYRRQLFFVRYERLIRAGIFLGIAVLILIILGVLGLVIYSNIPGRDDDRDGVPNTEDVCPGSDDAQDADHDGVPDGCEEQPETTEVKVLESTIIPVGQDRYDVAVLVQNPNIDWGASPLEYSIQLLAADGSLINTSSRAQSFLLPGERKHLTAFNVLAVQTPTAAQLAVSYSEWMKVQNYQTPNFETTTVSYEQIEEPGVFARLKGKTTNRTTFTFDNVKINVLIRDNTGKLIAINQSEVDTLQPAEGRDFIVTFPQQLHGVTAANISYETDVDVFRNDTFVQTTVVRGQRFQQFTPQSPD